jgi:DNA-binding transcriptional ArsR family regulator
LAHSSCSQFYSLHFSTADLARHFDINGNIRFSIDLTATTGVTHMVKQTIGQQKRRKRDYSKEYERRVQRGLAKGLSLSQARGHARPTEAPVSRKAISFEQWSRVLELAVARMRQGDSLTNAARIASVSPERLARYVARTGIAEKSKGRWRLLDDTRIRIVPLYSDGRLVELQVGLLTASKIGAYMATVGHALRKNSFEALAPFEGELAVDLNGKSYFFETRPNTLYRLNQVGEQPFEQIYKIIN